MLLWGQTQLPSVKYLLENSCSNSRTWSINSQNLSRMYEIEDPFLCLQRDSLLRLLYQMLLLQDYICSCGAIKTEAQLNAESVTLSAGFSLVSGRGRCFDTFYFVSLWRAEQSMSHGNFEGGQSRGSHVTRPALPGPLNRVGQDRML